MIEMNTKEYFIDQLKNIRDEIIHGFQKMIPDQSLITTSHFIHPKAQEKIDPLKNTLGEWSVFCDLVRLDIYEEFVTYTEMKNYFLNEEPVYDNKKYGNALNELLEEQNVETALKRFQKVRESQVVLLQNCENSTLNGVSKNTHGFNIHFLMGVSNMHYCFLGTVYGLYLTNYTIKSNF